MNSEIRPHQYTEDGGFLGQLKSALHMFSTTPRSAEPDYVRKSFKLPQQKVPMLTPKPKLRHFKKKPTRPLKKLHYKHKLRNSPPTKKSIKPYHYMKPMHGHFSKEPKIPKEYKENLQPTTEHPDYNYIPISPTPEPTVPYDVPYPASPTPNPFPETPSPRDQGRYAGSFSEQREFNEPITVPLHGGGGLGGTPPNLFRNIPAEDSAGQDLKTRFYSKVTDFTLEDDDKTPVYTAIYTGNPSPNYEYEDIEPKYAAKPDFIAEEDQIDKEIPVDVNDMSRDEDFYPQFEDNDWNKEHFENPKKKVTPPAFRNFQVGPVIEPANGIIVDPYRRKPSKEKLNFYENYYGPSTEIPPFDSSLAYGGLDKFGDHFMTNRFEKKYFASTKKPNLKQRETVTYKPEPVIERLAVFISSDADQEGEDDYEEDEDDYEDEKPRMVMTEPFEPSNRPSFGPPDGPSFGPYGHLNGQEPKFDQYEPDGDEENKFESYGHSQDGYGPSFGPYTHLNGQEPKFDQNEPDEDEENKFESYGHSQDGYGPKISPYGQIEQHETKFGPFGQPVAEDSTYGPHGQSIGHEPKFGPNGPSSDGPFYRTPEEDEDDYEYVEVSEAPKNPPPPSMKPNDIFVKHGDPNIRYHESYPKPNEFENHSRVKMPFKTFEYSFDKAGKNYIKSSHPVPKPTNGESLNPSNMDFDKNMNYDRNMNYNEPIKPSTPQFETNYAQGPMRPKFEVPVTVSPQYFDRNSFVHDHGNLKRVDEEMLRYQETPINKNPESSLLSNDNDHYLFDQRLLTPALRRKLRKENAPPVFKPAFTYQTSNNENTIDEEEDEAEEKFEDNRKNNLRTFFKESNTLENMNQNNPMYGSFLDNQDEESEMMVVPTSGYGREMSDFARIEGNHFYSSRTYLLKG